LEGDGLRGGEKGHGRGKDEMVVVIEQVVKQDQSLKRIGGWVRDRIGTNFAFSAVVRRRYLTTILCALDGDNIVSNAASLAGSACSLLCGVRRQ
jgi:hypothetical protein